MKYKKHQVLNEFTLNVKEGEVYGFLGQNGTGKTTTDIELSQEDDFKDIHINIK